MDRLLELTCQAEESHFWFRGFRQFVRPLLARAARASARPRRLLDCGCGTGANLALLGAFGDAYGFDLNWQGLALARDRGRRVAQASIASIPFPSGHFDIVTSFDVFQSLPEPVEQAAIREMHRVLKPGGHVVMSAAALEVLRGRHSALSEEVRRYSKAGLRTLFERAGFAVERVTFTHASLLPILLPTRLLQRLSSNGTPAAGEFEITVPAAPINMMLSGALTLEALALKVADMPIGSSLVVHASKVGPR